MHMIGRSFTYWWVGGLSKSHVLSPTIVFTTKFSQLSEKCVLESVKLVTMPPIHVS